MNARLTPHTVNPDNRRRFDPRDARRLKAHSPRLRSAAAPLGHLGADFRRSLAELAALFVDHVTEDIGLRPQLHRLHTRCPWRYAGNDQCCPVRHFVFGSLPAECSGSTRNRRNHCQQWHLVSSVVSRSAGSRHRKSCPADRLPFRIRRSPRPHTVSSRYRRGSAHAHSAHGRIGRAPHQSQARVHYRCRGENRQV